MTKLFAWVFGFIVLISGCTYAFDKASQRNDTPLVQATSDSTYGEATSNILQHCLDMVAAKPGDVAFIEKYGWKIVCSQSGDPDLDATGDVETLGYTSFQKKTIFLSATEISNTLIVHEAAHALDDIAFDQLLVDWAAMQLGATDWFDTPDYWSTPAEMFAESRAGCLGFEADSDFKAMSCDLIDQMIAKTDYANEIATLVEDANS